MSNSTEMSLFMHYMLVRNEDEFERDDIIRKKVYAEPAERSKTVRSLIKKLTSSTASAEKGGSSGHTSKSNSPKNSFRTTVCRVHSARPTMPSTRKRWNLDQGKPEERHSKNTTKRGESTFAGASGLAKKFEKIKCEVNDSDGQTSPSTNEKSTEGFVALSTPVDSERKTENAVLEFEDNYLSNPEEAPKGGNFVKKIVAVFEEKCRQSNNWKFDRASIHSEPSADATSLASKKKRCSLQNFFGSRATRGKEETSSKSVELPSNRYVERSTAPSFEGEDETDCGGCEDRSRKERTPKIIGAYLKKPIEVNETSINWIPLIGKKLPRKKSFKKLLSVLSARKKADSWKRKVVFASQQDLRKEVREAQDSGYDDKSSSVSSSVASFTEAQQHEQVVNVEWARKSAAFKTFQSLSSVKNEVKLNGNGIPPKKLLLDEIPRSVLSVDLSPISPYGPGKTLTKSLDRRTPKSVRLSPLPKHPYASSIPKHPFVSFSKENLEDIDSTRIVSNGLYEVELRRPFYDQQSSEFFLENIHYGMRKHWSDPGLSVLSEEPIYDVPRPIEIPRPRSCVYQEALALRWRGGKTSVCFEEKSRYATVKPRNAKVSLSDEFLRSVKSENVGIYHGKGLVQTVTSTVKGNRAF